MNALSNPINASSASLVNPNISSLSDTPARQVDAHLLEFLSMEILKQLTQSEAVARSRKLAQDQLVQDPSVTGIVNITLNGKEESESAAKLKESQLSEEGVKKRLENMGYKVGWAMAERLARDRPRFPAAPSLSLSGSSPSAASTGTMTTTPDPLETIKFVCKDLWIEMYDKQIDNLRTNHRGVYVLLDNRFSPLLKISATSGEQEIVNKQIRLTLAAPCGIIRGALASLGLSVSVSVESNLAPQCTFQIKTTKAS